MSVTHPYRALVAGFAELLEQGAALPLGVRAPGRSRQAAPDVPGALIFSPHPDDECIIAGLPLRLQQQCGYAVTNVAVTQGSREDRRTERWRELRAACDYLGFGLIATAAGGLERIDPHTRATDPEHWAAAVEVIAGILDAQRPAVIFMPHEADWNRTHIGTHYLVLDALSRQSAAFACHVVETEFWGAMNTPNLLVASSIEDLADMLAALSCHVGEVRRNPYHLRLPAWMIDNVRRGAERVGGQGGSAPDMPFATLYRLRRWRDGSLQPGTDSGRLLAVRDDPRQLFL